MATSSQRLRKCQWVGLATENHWHRQVFLSLDILTDKQHQRAQVHVPREEWDLTSKLRCLVAQSCPTLCDPWTAAHQAPLSMGILQARILE